jgi:hypothetical protein
MYLARTMAAPTTQLMCKRCYATQYSSKECQKRDWPMHKMAICDPVASWIAGMKAQGCEHLGGCTQAEAAEARTHFPECKDVVFITFHKFILPSGTMTTSRYHLHTPDSPPCAENGAIKCHTFLGKNMAATSIPPLPKQ